MRKYFISILCILFIGCKPVKEIVEVPVEVIKEVEKKVYVHDTTYTNDSTIIFIKGDTILKEHIKYIYVGKTIHDTLSIKDSVEKPIYITNTVTKTVNKPQWWPVWLLLGVILSYFIVTKTKIINYIKPLLKLLKIFK